MAKIKKRKLHWKASESPQVVGYKLYWADGGNVDYESPSAALGNVTQVLLPDDIADFSPGKGPVEFGITAVDELGNESDMITFSAAYQFNVPEAPQDVSMVAMDEFHATDTSLQKTAPVAKPIQLYEKEPPDTAEQDAREDDESHETVPVEDEEKPLKYYGQSDQD